MAKEDPGSHRTDEELKLRKSQMRFSALLGIILIGILLLVSFLIPNPTQFQYNVFRLFIALCGALISAMLPGMIYIRIGKIVTATGAMGIFIFLWYFSPVELVSEKPPGKPVQWHISQDRTVVSVFDSDGKVCGRLETKTTINVALLINSGGNKDPWLVLGYGEKGDKRGYVSLYQTAPTGLKEIWSVDTFIPKYFEFDDDPANPALTTKGGEKIKTASSGFFEIVSIAEGRFFEGRTRGLVVAANDPKLAPSMLHIIEIGTGDILYSIYHPGQLLHLLTEDLDGDGITEVLAAGVNNNLGAGLIELVGQAGPLKTLLIGTALLITPKKPGTYHASLTDTTPETELVDYRWMAISHPINTYFKSNIGKYVPRTGKTVILSTDLGVDYALSIHGELMEVSVRDKWRHKYGWNKSPPLVIFEPLIGKPPERLALRGVGDTLEQYPWDHVYEDNLRPYVEYLVKKARSKAGTE